jgi:drug/metabolite transporter (DMT)-like permease
MQSCYMKYFILFIYVTGLSFGQLIFKTLAIDVKTQEILTVTGNLSFLLTQRMFYISILVYGLLTLLWIYILTFLNFSNISLVFVATVILNAYIGEYYFGEVLTRHFYVGFFLIIIGVFFIGFYE